MEYLVDTSIWIEYFQGSEIGRKFHEISRKNNSFYFTDCILAEAKEKCIKANMNFNAMHSFMKGNAQLIATTTKDWLNAVNIKLELRKSRPNFGIIDALILQKQENKILLTKDKHFKGLPNVKILE